MGNRYELPRNVVCVGKVNRPNVQFCFRVAFLKANFSLAAQFTIGVLTATSVSLRLVFGR
jgi:hypothetical protein